MNSYIDKIDTITNCAPCQDKTKTKTKFKTCYSIESLIKIANIWNENNKDKYIKIDKQSKRQIWKKIQKNLNMVCSKNEYCWKKQNFIKKIKDIEIEMFTFKPDYPEEWFKNEKTWLNTYDIYYVMKQYEKTYNDFIFLGPVPSDCPTQIHCELTKLDLIELKKKKINKIGIIYNLDKSSGNGTHWVALYIDNKNDEINYYDSYGTIPIKLIHNFIKNIAIKHNLKIIYNDKRHQYGNSECGVYSMNFILERLHGKTMYDISNMKIPDSHMNYLRKLLYNKSK